MLGIDTAAKAQQALDDHKNRKYEPHQAYDWAIDLAKYEGMAEMFEYIEDLAERGHAKGLDDQTLAFTLMKAVVKRLSRGADDKWSGRGNDEKRARFDGMCDAASELEYNIGTMFKGE